MANDPKIDPITGLEVKTTINPITGLPEIETPKTYARAGQQGTGVRAFAATTGDFSRYGDYNIGVSPSPVDYNEIRAQRQGNLEKFGRGLTKMGVTAGASFANTFTGLAGLADFVFDYTTPLAERSLANSQRKIQQSLKGTFLDTEDWRESIRKTMPHYYTQEELAKQGTLGGMLTMNFLTDKFADGLGFFLGTAASLYATGGVGVLGSAGKAAGLSRGLAAWRAGKTLASGKSVADAVKTYRNTKNFLSKVGGGAAYLEASVYSAMGESALEAMETGKITYERLLEEAQAEKAFLGLGPLTTEEIQQLKLQAQEAEAAAFYGNLAVLTLSNSITFRGLLRPFNKNKVASSWLRPTTGAEKAANMGNVVDKLSTLPVGIRQVAQAGRYSAPFLKTALTEGSEEAAQYAIQESMAEYELAKLKDAGLGDLAESLLASNRLNTLKDAAPLIGGKALETFSNPESREQFIIGSLVGLFGSGTSNYRQSQAAREKRDIQKTLFDSPAFYNIAARSEDGSVMSSMVEAMEEAQKTGNEELYNYYQDRLRAAQVLSHINAGSIDMFKEMMQDTKDLSDAEFKQLFGYEPDAKVDKNQVINNLIESAEEIERSSEFIDNMFTTNATRGAARLFMSKEQKQQEKDMIKDENTYKNYLKQELGTLKMVDGAILNKLNTVEELFPGSDLVIDVTQKDGRVRRVNMKDRLRRYARSRFGKVDEEGTKLISGPKLVENLNNLLGEAAQQLSPEELIAFRKEVVELQSLIAQKDNAATALRNLMRDPEARDLALSRAKLVETIARQQKIDQMAEDAISETMSGADLDAKVAGLREAGVSDAAIEKVNEEVRRRDLEVVNARKNWDTMKRSEVVALKDLTPLQEANREEYLKTRTQEEPLVDPITESRKKAANRDRERRNQTRDKLAGTQPQKGTQQDPGAPSPTTATSNTADALFTTHQGNREVFLIGEEGNKKVLVSSTGQPTPTDLHALRTVNGQPVIDRPDLLDTDQVTAGTEVELVVVEDAWWLENRNNPQYANQAEHIPIYVKVPGKGIIGILAANNSALRKTVFEEYQKGEEGKPVTITIGSKQLNNFNNARVQLEDGTSVPFLSNVLDVIGDVPIGVVVYDKESATQKSIRIGNLKDMSPTESAALKNKAYEASEKLKYGQTVAFFKDSNNKWRYAVLQTAKLNQSEQERALELLTDLSNEAFEELVNLVGLNELVPAAYSEADSNTYLAVEDRFIPGTSARVIRVAIPIPTSASTDPNSFFIASINSEILGKLVRGEITSKDLIGKDEYKGVVGNLVQEVSIDEEQRVTTRGVGFNVLKGDQVAQFIDSFVDNLALVLANKFRQVSIDAMQADPSYFQELANTPHDTGASDRALGYKGVISTDLVRVNGGLFNGINLVFDTAQLKVDGKKVTAQTAPVSALVPNSVDAQAAFDQAAAARKAEQPDPTDAIEKFLAEQDPNTGGSSIKEVFGVETAEEVAALQAQMEEAERRAESGDRDASEAELASIRASLLPDPEAFETAEEYQAAVDKVKASKEWKATETTPVTKEQQDVNDAADNVEPPFRLAEEGKQKLNRQQATKWLEDRGIPVEFYDTAQEVGGLVAHGYMKNAMVYLWNNAEVGTEYHEAFHYAFRTALSEKQRQALYREARKKYNLPKATELELEEAMAEDFRDYVFTAQETAKSLPGKIRKFFSDLWNYIKALFVNPVGVEQFFSLIEANKIPKKYERSAERFANTTAYRLVSSIPNYEVQKQVVDSISSIFIKKWGEMQDANEEYNFADKVLAEQLLGKPSTKRKGDLADFFLQHSMTTAQGEYLSEEALQAFVNAKTKEERGKVASKYSIILGVPLQARIEGALPTSVFQKDVTGVKSTAKIFYDIWNNWFDVQDNLGNVDKFGWREAVIIDLRRYGYKVKGYSQARITLENTEEGLAQQEETNYDKVYDISHFEVDPIKTQSQEVRRLFSQLAKDKPNDLGLYTYADIEDMMRAAVATTKGAQSYEEILGNIQAAAENFDVLKPLAKYLSSNPSPQEAAAIRSFLTKTYSEQRIIQEEKLEDVMVVKAINSDRKSAAIGWATTWKNESTQTTVVNRETAVLAENEDGSLRFHNNVVDGKERLEHIRDAVRAYNAAKTVEDRATAINDLMWYMSLGMAKTKAEAGNRLRTYLNKHDNGENQETQKLYNKIVNSFVSKVLSVNREGGVVTGIKLRESVVNPFVSEGSTLKELAEVAANFSLPIAIAYVNGKGKTIYPYNLPTIFSETLADLQKGRDSELYNLMLQDPSLRMGDTKARALMLYLIENENFEIESFALDTLQNEVALEDENLEYNKISERDSLILRLNMFLNQGQNYSYIPLPVQETRGRMDFLKVPKFGDISSKSVQAAGIPAMSGQAMIKNIFLRDLVRLSENPKLANKYNGGFHMMGMQDRTIKGGRLSKVVRDAMDNPNAPEYQAFRDEVNRQVRQYIETTMSEYKAELVQELTKYNIIKVEEGEYVLPADSRIDDSHRKYGSLSEMIDSYMITDLVSRVEMAQMFRGGVSQFADVAAFYKRMGLLNTPGTKLMLRGEFAADLEYGMPTIIKEASIQKINNTDPFHDEIAGRIKKMFLNYYTELGYTAEEAELLAENLAAPYRNNDDVDHTDAQAYISPNMFRYIEQGLGRWTPADDVWFEEYLKGGEWKAKYTPAYKFYAEQRLIDNGVLNVDMQKNSYVVLTKELVAGNPTLEAMYNKMMTDNIDIINTESAKKGFKGQLFKVNQELGESMFDGLQAREMKGSSLFMPQIINNKKDMEAKMNRQIRKTIPTMVKENEMYTLPSGEKISGKDLVEKYHELHEQIIDAQYKKLSDEIGWTKLSKDIGNRELRLAFLQRVRELIYDNAIKNNKIDSNLDKQFRIVQDLEESQFGFNVPTEFPVYQEYQNLIFSLFKSNVYTVKMPGRELVQVAATGKWNIDGEIRELRHLDLTDDGEVIPAEVMISQDIADRLGIKVGYTGVMYRIPNQDYSSSVPVKVVGILPRGYSKSVIVPGGITIQTGSDFDIDKLFGLFRKENPKTKLEQQKNELLDLVEGVLRSKHTAPYLFKPLTQDTLDALAQDPLYKRDGSKAFDNPLVEVKMESNYKSAATLVGGYANAIAGWNIAAVASQYDVTGTEYTNTGTIVHPSKHFVLNGKILNEISMISPFSGERTLDGIVERLSAALDAAKGLIHNTLNDNEQTLNATVYLKSIGFEDADVVALMTTPLVRDFVERRRIKRGENDTTAFFEIAKENEMGVTKKDFSAIKNFEEDLTPAALTTEGLREITKNQDRTSQEAQEAFVAFAHAHFAGNSLSQFYEVIASDNLDSMGDLAEVEAYLDTLDNYKRGGERNIVGYTQVQKILEGPAYKISRAYFNMFKKSMEVNSQLFLAGTQGVRGFKQHFKNITGKDRISAQEHRYINRALFYHMITKDGSPLGEILSKRVVKDMLLDPNNNLYTQVKEVIANNPELADNTMLAKIVEGVGYSDPVNRVWGITIENTEKMTPAAREQVRRDFNSLLESTNPEVSNLAKRLILNSIVHTGFSPSYGSYYNSIPVEFFLNVKDANGKSLMQYVREESEKIRNDETYFEDFTFGFMQNYGAATIGGRPLVPRMSRSFAPVNKSTLIMAARTPVEGQPARYATVADYKAGVDKVSVYEYKDGAYYKIQSLGINGKLLELNLRDNNGEIVSDSFWSAANGARIVRVKTGSGKVKEVNLQSRQGITSSQVLNVMKLTPDIIQPKDTNNIDKTCQS